MDGELNRLASKLAAGELLTETAEMAVYTTDIIHSASTAPLAVARPASTASVVKIVKWCQANQVAIIPQGGLTGLCGGALPDSSARSLAVSMGRMNAIREIDTIGNTATVEAGVILADLQTAAEDHDRVFPLRHGAEGSSQIGGVLSTNAGGNNALRYGTARAHLLGLEVVLPDGNVWNGLRRLRKNTAGYDLKQMFVGAEGSLGIITAAVLAIRPRPSFRQCALVTQRSVGDALSLLRRIQGTAGEIVSAFEIMSTQAIDHAAKFMKISSPFPEATGWIILLELDLAGEQTAMSNVLENSLSAAMDIGLVTGALVAQSETQRLEFWRLRESVAMSSIEDKSCLKSDTAVPVDRIAEFIQRAGSAVDEIVGGAKPIPFGHVGDGNIHFNVSRPDGQSHESFRARWPEMRAAIEAVALELDGTISAEHGLGRLKVEAYRTSADPVERDLMQRIKQALDPQNLMNPGAVLKS